MLKEPKSMSECVYYTDREIGKGRVKTWAFKKICPKCGKAIMGKPVEKGKVKIRAKEYVCPECGYKEEQQEYEDSLTASIQYICPYCNHKGEIEIPFKRKKIKILNEETGKKTSTESLRFQCEKCGKDIDVTKKMK